jgi:parvulin-like peptidyl-prolyl isomerase
MKRPLTVSIMILAITVSAAGQMASHTPTAMVQQQSAMVAPQAAGKPVARVNGTVLTDVDLLREMLTIFPYARQHNGFPKAMESDIRNGAMKMMVFEELVYQEALRRGLTIPPARMNQAVADFQQQFSSREEYEQFLNAEFKGSTQQLRIKIKRSLLIDALLKTEVEGRSTVSLAEAKAYFEQHLDRFRIPETFSIQTISVLPPPNATEKQLKEARKRADDAVRQAKATKNYEEFGMLAEKISEDDYRVMMGDHKAVDRAALPPAMLRAALAMKPGQVSDLIQVEQVYTVFRLNAHNPAAAKTFAEVKDSLRKELQIKKREQLRASLDKRLRQSAKVEEL